VAKLFLARGAHRFRCRCCLDLAYASQRESDVERAIRRVRKLRGRIGEDDLMRPTPFIEKPRRMWSRTYHGVIAEIVTEERILESMLDAAIARFERYSE
jgi:hypothetical protein